MFGKILVATDGSECGLRAVEYALKLAADGSSVTAVCVFDNGGFNAKAIGSSTDYKAMVRKLTDSALDPARDLARGTEVKFNTKVVCGRPAHAVAEMSADYDLVVCGTVGKTGMPRMLLGSVAENIVRLAKCPVLVVR